MAFLLYKKIKKDGALFYQTEVRSFSLAGYNLIYNLWVRKNKPRNQGWSVNANELLSIIDETFTSDSHALVIDFHPNADYRIGLIEIDRIHLYTYGKKEEDFAYWTPMMLELKSLYYDEYEEPISKDEKNDFIDCFEPPATRKRIVEFLYLNGTENGWNWGKNGMTNAAFIEEDSREYFKRFF